MGVALRSDAARQTWFEHLDACAVCGDISQENACPTGHRLAFEVSLAEDADDGLLPEMDAAPAN